MAAQADNKAFGAGVVLDGSVSMGVDIVEVARMRKVIGRSPSFLRKCFTEGERTYCDSYSTPEFHYACRFAAKEAVVKALGTGFSGGIRPADIEVVTNAKGRPSVRLHGAAAAAAAEQGVLELPISLSYTHTEAVACAMAITEESVSAAKRRVDPTEELTRRFKKARLLLDELEPPAPEPEQQKLPGFTRSID